MSKLRIVLEDLRVETFETRATDDAESRGTVFARGDTRKAGCYTEFDLSGCDRSCERFCHTHETCDLSCAC